MEQSAIVSVVNILIKLPNVVENWPQLFYTLNNGNDFEHFSRQRKNSTITEFELFKKTLDLWVSKQGDNGTVTNLCQVLRKMEFNEAAGEFSQISFLFIKIN